MKKWQSRSTIFAAFFAVTAFVLALKGLLVSQYVAAITAVGAYVTGRAIAEDYHERSQPKEDEGAKVDNPDAKS